MTLNQSKLRGCLVVLSGFLCMAVAYSSTQTHRRRASRAGAPHHRKANKSSRKASPAKVRRRGRNTARSRLARLHMEPQRVEEIQHALINAGDLQERPTGKWDQQTREAMARYQAQNGFPVTGLPDAKSLMKLGLGPHSLPAELDRASLSLSTTSGHATDAGSDRKPETPHEER